MSSNLVKIKDVILHVGLSETGTDQYIAYKSLANANIKFQTNSYGDHFDGHNATFSALNTWSWGVNAEKRIFDHFPILTWTECYDDFSLIVQNAVDSSNIANSSVIANKSLIT